MARSTKEIAKSLLLLLLAVFSAGAIIFSLVILFTDLGFYRKVNPAQARGMFTTFIHSYINEVHPERPRPGSSWSVTNVSFVNDNFAVVEAGDGDRRTKMEFIFTVEPPNVRVLTINDITKRDLEDAQLALQRYLEFLHEGKFSEAEEFFGGSFSRLVPYSGGELNIAYALEQYCRTVSRTGSCMLFRIKDSRRDPDTGSYLFTVNFLRDDGTTYSGNDDKINYSGVVEERADGEFVVLSLPFD